MHTKRRRQRLSKRKGGQGRLLSSYRRSSRYRNALEPVKIHLDTLKQQLHRYKEKNGKTKTHDKFTKFTMKHASRIIKKGYDTFSKLKLQGGAGDEDESPPEDRCQICYESLFNGRVIICPESCMHMAHSHCLRRWWRSNPSCPLCRIDGDLPPISDEERLEQQAHPEEQEHEQEQPDWRDPPYIDIPF